MPAPMMQATLRDRLLFEGVGLHTGAQCRAELLPAEVDAGICFVAGGTRIPATVEYVVDTTRATVLGRDGVSISTTEHLLSALLATGVTNCEIHVDGPEIPVLDGSAFAFVTGISECGLQPQPQERHVLELTEPLFVRDGDKLIAALPAASLRVRFTADFPNPIGTQYFSGEIDARSYQEEIAGARTFGYLHEIQALLERGLARGGSLDNALVFTPEGPMQELRWPNEAVRHKVLDLIGDLALLGAWPQFEIVAIKSGHELHCTITNVLRTQKRLPSN